MQSQFGPLPLPSPPSWLAAGISTLLETEAPPPSQLSGATLEVQRQQHMDRLEQMMASFHQNRQVCALSYHTLLTLFTPSLPPLSLPCSPLSLPSPSPLPPLSLPCSPLSLPSPSPAEVHSP